MLLLLELTSGDSDPSGTLPGPTTVHPDRKGMVSPSAVLTGSLSNSSSAGDDDCHGRRSTVPRKVVQRETDTLFVGL